MLLGTCVLTSAVLFGGCGFKKTEAVATPTPEPTAAPTATPEPTPTAAPTVTPVPMVKTIGQDSAGAFKVSMKNLTGKNITGFSVKQTEAAEYPASMLGENDPFAVSEERTLYYNPGAQENQQEVSGAVYDVSLTFEDGSVLELHAFPFGDVEVCEIHLEDGVAYVTYTSTSTQEAVSTKESELYIAESAAAAETYVEPSYDQQGYVDYSYQEPAYQEPAYQEPVYQEPVYQEPVYQEPVYTDPGMGGGDGCLQGGLVY